MLKRSICRCIVHEKEMIDRFSLSEDALDRLNQHFFPIMSEYHCSVLHPLPSKNGRIEYMQCASDDLIHVVVSILCQSSYEHRIIRQ